MLNSSGQYIGFPEIKHNLYYDNDLLSMLGVKYIVDQEGIVPEDTMIAGQDWEITEATHLADEVRILQSEEFKSVMEQRTCRIHPLLLKAYESGNYRNVLLVGKISETKRTVGGYLKGKRRNRP